MGLRAELSSSSRQQYNNGSPVPQQEGEWCDEDEIPWGRVRMVMGEWGGQEQRTRCWNQGRFRRLWHQRQSL